jgi:RimJ/RimL family protein N-acetyltransferase
MIPELATERLMMRAFREDDFPAFAAFCADGETAHYVGGVCAEDDAWRRMAAFAGHWALRGYGIWALQLRDNDAFVGYCGSWSPHGWPEREIAWGLVKAHQGRGYVTEAARRARLYAYDTLGWSTVVSCIAQENAASIRVAERLGATFERAVENRGWTVGVYRHPAPSISI